MHNASQLEWSFFVPVTIPIFFLPLVQYMSWHCWEILQNPSILLYSINLSWCPTAILTLGDLTIKLDAVA